jgi:hypothetical protein
MTHFLTSKTPYFIFIFSKVWSLNVKGPTLSFPLKDDWKKGCSTLWNLLLALYDLLPTYKANMLLVLLF